MSEKFHADRLNERLFTFFCVPIGINGPVKLTVLSTSLGKIFFLAICLFFFLYLKLNLRPKIGLTYALSIINCFFPFNFFSKKLFLLFFAEFKLLIFHNSIVKSSEKLNKRNVLKILL